MTKQLTINYKPTKKQFEALQYLLDDTTDEVLFGGAAGGGKSFLGCAWLIIMCSKYQKSRWLMGREKLKTLKETTLKTFFNVAKQFGLVADVDYAFNGATNVITFKNGSEILLKDLFAYPSDPDFDSLGSLEIAGAFIDEVAQVSRKAREIVKSRMGWKLPDGSEIKPKLYMSCNPNKGFAYKDFYLPHRDNKLPSNMKFIPALPSSNEYLSEGRQSSLNNLKGIERARLLNGQWEYNSDPNALIEYDSILDIFHNSHIVVPQGTKRRDDTIFSDKCITWDVAGKGKDKAIILAWHGLQVIDSKTILIDDGTIQTNTIKDFKLKYNISNSQLIYDSDGLGSLEARHFPGCVEFKGGATPFNKENYKNLKTQCYYKLADIINGKELYWNLLDEDVQLTVVEELEQVKSKNFDKDGHKEIIGKDEVKSVLARSPDYSDALMMRMYPLVKHRSQNFNDTYSFASF